MTMDPSRSSEEGPLWASGGVKRGARAFYCVIRNIWTILKRSDGQRRWNVISSHSWPEKKRLRCWCQRAETAAAIQPRAALCAAQGAAESRARPRPGPPKPGHMLPASSSRISNLIRTLVLSLDIISAAFAEEKVIFPFSFFPSSFWPHNSHLADYINALACFHWWPAALLTSVHRSIGQFCRQRSKRAETPRRRSS